MEYNKIVYYKGGKSHGQQTDYPRRVYVLILRQQSCPHGQYGKAPARQVPPQTGKQAA